MDTGIKGEEVSPFEGEIRLTKPVTPREFEAFLARLAETGTVIEEITEAVIKVSR